MSMWNAKGCRAGQGWGQEETGEGERERKRERLIIETKQEIWGKMEKI